jgi:hypothetical protein
LQPFNKTLLAVVVLATVLMLASTTVINLATQVYGTLSAANLPTTLTSGTAITNANLTTPTLGVATATSVNGQYLNRSLLTSAYTNATISATTIMSFAVAASTNYVMHCHGLYKTSSTSGHPTWTISGPASPTGMTYDFQLETNLSSGAATTYTVLGTGTAYPAAVGPASLTVATDLVFDVNIGFRNGTTAGTLALQMTSSSTSYTMTVEAGSWCNLE